MTIDWSKPIEAVTRSGSVRRATYDRKSQWAASHLIAVEGETYPLWFNDDGHGFDSYDIRNVADHIPDAGKMFPEHPTPTQYAPELVERMVVVLKGYVAGSCACDYGPDKNRSVYGEACAIVSDLPHGVDPDEAEAAAILEAANFQRQRDPHYSMILEVAKDAIARGRQLQRGEAA